MQNVIVTRSHHCIIQFQNCSDKSMDWDLESLFLLVQKCLKIRNHLRSYMLEITGLNSINSNLWEGWQCILEPITEKGEADDRYFLKINCERHMVINPTWSITCIKTQKITAAIHNNVLCLHFLYCTCSSCGSI